MAQFQKKIHPRRTVIAVRSEIAKMRADGLSWRAIAKTGRFSGVTAAALCALSKHGRVPQNKEIRVRLGLTVENGLYFWPVDALARAIANRVEF